MSIYENHQWSVTEDGIESMDEHWGYLIEADRLLAVDWPLHMVKKTWVDASAFMTAWRKAIEYHYPGVLSEAELVCVIELAVLRRRGQDARGRVRRALFPAKSEEPFRFMSFEQLQRECRAVDELYQRIRQRLRSHRGEWGANDEPNQLEETRR